MAGDNCQIAIQQPQGLSNELAETTGSQNQNAVCGADFDLLLDLKCGRQRFHKNSRIIGYRIRNRLEIFQRQAQVFGEGAVAVFDTQDGTIFTVRGLRCETIAACSAADIDFAHHPLSDTIRLVGCQDNFAHKFMSRYAAKWVISFYQFQIGSADAGLANLNPGFARNGLGLRHIFAKFQGLVFQPDSAHASILSNRLCLGFCIFLKTQFAHYPLHIKKEMFS